MKAHVEGHGEPVVAAELDPDEWIELRRTHHAARRTVRKPLCTCPDCGHGLHPKEFGGTTRFFAHNPASPPDCPLKALDGESGEHRRLKQEIFSAIRRVKGWKPDVEFRAPEPHPVTGRPVFVDVVATRTDPRRRLYSKAGMRGWEVQLGRLDAGHVLDRHEHRARFLERCSWMTESRPAWANQLPWYQIASDPEHGDLVVDGVVRLHKHDDPALGTDYFLEPAFPHADLVRAILTGARWSEGVGWELAFSNGRATRGPKPQRRTVKGQVAEFCNRMRELPEETRAWSDEDWLKVALTADDRLSRNEPLTRLEAAALARFPAPIASRIALEGLEAQPAYDPLGAPQPCVICSAAVVVTIDPSLPIHHRCAWQLDP